MLVERARGAQSRSLRRADPRDASWSAPASGRTTVELLAPGTLPRTSSGKLRRAEAARLWQAGELRPPRAVNALTVAAAVVRSEVAFLRTKRRG